MDDINAAALFFVSTDTAICCFSDLLYFYIASTLEGFPDVRCHLAQFKGEGR